ncbi:MAG: hypothetical protein H6Q15_2171 [Bacteroidetes bacterium]|nr:hypothetical protein [Bacteroidota bacterium]
MKIASTKERILQYIEYKHISRPTFLKKTGIKRGFLDADKLNQAVSDDHFAKIIAIFHDLSIEWLLTGDGNMLKSSQQESLSITNTDNVTALISILNDTLKEKDRQIDRLLSIIEKMNK